MGLSGYFNRLFDDPGRMAMLSGGLSAMDPSSYYDKQGFGSPWTGLRGAFGAAQGGAKSVHDARKAKADLEKTKAEAESELSGSPKYKSAQIGDATYLYSDADIKRRRNELMADGKTGWQKATNMAILEAGTKIEKGITPNKRHKIRMEYSSGRLIGNTIDESIKLAADSFNVGAVGLGKRAWDGAKGIFSIDGKQTDATKLVNNIHKIVSQKWKDLVGGGQLSKNDELFIQKVIKNPENVFTTASEIRRSLNDIKRINDELQYRRAAILNIEHTSAGSSPTLGDDTNVDALIEEFE